MTNKWLRYYEAQYMKALAYAVVLGCDLAVEQFAAAYFLDAEELDELRAHLERQGVNV